MVSMPPATVHQGAGSRHAWRCSEQSLRLAPFPWPEHPDDSVVPRPGPPARLRLPSSDNWQPNMTDGFATQPDRNRTCRFCGCRGNLHYCTRCGATVDDTVTPLTNYLWKRLRELLLFASRFIFTTLPLLLLPGRFFAALSTDGQGVDGGLLLFGRREGAICNPWRRPLPPLAYAVGAVAITVSIASIWWNSIKVQQTIEQLGLASTDPIAYLMVSLIVEVVLLSGTLCIAYAHGSLLGIRNLRNAPTFIEYIVYASTLCYLLVFSVACGILAAGPELDQPIHIWGVLFLSSMIPSAYCFILVPARIGGMLGVATCRGLFAYPGLALAAGLWLGLPLVWLAHRMGLVT